MASLVAASSAVITSSTSTVAREGLALRSSFVAAPSKVSEWGLKTVSNGSRVSAMLVWSPYDNKKFETLSYLPPLSDGQIAKEIDYMIRNGWIPCLEFCDNGYVYRKYNNSPGYYDGRYWTMWKLPMYGCTDSAAVLREIQECVKQYPNNFVRVLGFDNKRQVQCAGFLVYKPPSA